MGAAGDSLRIRIVPGVQPLVFVHPNLGNLFRVAPGEACTCQYGVRAVAAGVIFDPAMPRDSLAVTEALADRLLMRGSTTSLMAQIVGSHVQVGPLIGILCNPVWREGQHTLLRTKQLEALSKLVDAGLKLGAVCYLFRIDDIDFQQLTTRAFVKTDSGWKRVTLPLPDVVYDQVISRRRERSKNHTKHREQLSSLYGKRIFNDGFFDKWEVHDWIQQDQRLRRHIPQTVRHTQTASSAVFLQRHAVTFLKPVHGSLGLGIVRIARQSDGSFHYDINRAKQAPLHGTAQNAQEVMKVFHSRLNGRPYLLQQGISLAVYEERPFDIRILLQRDGTGEWCRTKMFARVAKLGDFTSNISGGGEALPVHKVFTEVFDKPGQAKSCQRELVRVSRWVTEVMERASGKVFGEMGLDIGVDSSGRVWVIEVNSKPWKAPYTEKGRQDLVDLSFTRPIEYAVWLTQQK